jgi:hypothetical protein
MILYTHATHPLVFDYKNVDLFEKIKRTDPDMDAKFVKYAFLKPFRARMAWKFSKSANIISLQIFLNILIRHAHWFNEKNARFEFSYLCTVHLLSIKFLAFRSKYLLLTFKKCLGIPSIPLRYYPTIG